MYFDELLTHFSHSGHHAYFMRVNISAEKMEKYTRITDNDQVITEHVQGIDEMRQLVQKLALRHHIPSLYIISPITWSIDIQNTLLKTLEEPAHNVHIVVHSPAPSFSFLPTITSRAQEVYLSNEKGMRGDEVVRVESFLKGNAQERLKSIEKITREDLINLLVNLEQYIGKEIIEKKNTGRIKLYHDIQRLSAQAQHPSSMTKMIAEYLALLDFS